MVRDYLAETSCYNFSVIIKDGNNIPNNKSKYIINLHLANIHR